MNELLFIFNLGDVLVYISTMYGKKDPLTKHTMVSLPLNCSQREIKYFVYLFFYSIIPMLNTIQMPKRTIISFNINVEEFK